jgi:hypothetical protein
MALRLCPTLASPPHVARIHTLSLNHVVESTSSIFTHSWRFIDMRDQDGWLLNRLIHRYLAADRAVQPRREIIGLHVSVEGRERRGQ